MSASPTRTRWLIVALIFCMGVLMFIDRVNIAIAAQYIMPEYGLSDVQMGWIFSAFVLGYAILQIPGGALGDRFGPRRVLTGAIFWWSVFTVVTAVAGDWFLTSLVGVVGSFIVVRVLIGVGEAAGPPNYNRVVANWVAPGERALALGIATSGSALGAALTPPLIVWIMVTRGWRAAFYLAGVVGIFLALVCYWFVTDRPGEHSWVNATELQHITQVSGLVSQQSSAPGRTPWRVLLGRADLWFLTASYSVLGYIGYIYFSWFYLYLVNVRRFSVVSGGWYSAAPFLISAAVAPLGGWLSDYLSWRLGKRIGRCGIGFGGPLLAAGLIYAGAATTDPYLAVLFLSLGEGALFLSVAAYWATTIDLAKTYAGTVSGFMNMGGNLGGTLSPTLTPVLAQHFGWNSALYVAAALALLGAFSWLGVHPERAIDLGEEASTLCRGDSEDAEQAHGMTDSARTT
ncbi:MAG: MFS transporter [Deltaproteobacteria bacterium]|nr:MFS transporter [Deltaproteobacteria bacterium]